ncbi:MAG: SprT family zinc-dependent metalloprotease [Burkholderiales bacterium]|nr:SprT family zinc-dependent metalloprotease [Burkholderiales bacterium]
MSQQLRSTTLGDTLIDYTVKRSRRRRRISLTVDEQGLRVGAPLLASDHAIAAMLRQHASWVLGKLAEWQARRPPPRHWCDGDTLMLQGRVLRLAFETGPQYIQLHHDRIAVSPGLAGNADGIRATVTGWLRRQAMACFYERVAHFHPLLGVAAPLIRLSNARTRWGSCHIYGRIRLNWRLIQLPQHLIDYVVVHELAHLVEMNHSPRFWEAVARLIPDYGARRSEIRTEGHRYLLV